MMDEDDLVLSSSNIIAVGLLLFVVIIFDCFVLLGRLLCSVCNGLDRNKIILPKNKSTNRKVGNIQIVNKDIPKLDRLGRRRGGIFFFFQCDYDKNVVFVSL
jgi:hypothetical protein